MQTGPSVGKMSVGGDVYKLTWVRITTIKFMVRGVGEDGDTEEQT